jgi:hypothetical protein
MANYLRARRAHRDALILGSRRNGRREDVRPPWNCLSFGELLAWLATTPHPPRLRGWPNLMRRNRRIDCVSFLLPRCSRLSRPVGRGHVGNSTARRAWRRRGPCSSSACPDLSVREKMRIHRIVASRGGLDRLNRPLTDSPDSQSSGNGAYSRKVVHHDS